MSEETVDGFWDIIYKEDALRNVACSMFPISKHNRKYLSYKQGLSEGWVDAWSEIILIAEEVVDV